MQLLGCQTEIQCLRCDYKHVQQVGVYFTHTEKVSRIWYFHKAHLLPMLALSLKQTGKAS